MTDNATKTNVYSNIDIVAIVNKLMHLLFALGLFLVLFLPWYPGMLAPHPYESPTPGWLLLLGTPFLVALLFLSDIPLLPFLLLLLLGYILPWGSLLLCLLNLLLVFLRSQILVKVNLLILVLLFSASVALVVFLSQFEGESAMSGLMFGFWAHFGLLFIIVYEIVVLKKFSQ